MFPNRNHEVYFGDVRLRSGKDQTPGSPAHLLPYSRDQDIVKRTFLIPSEDFFNLLHGVPTKYTLHLSGNSDKLLQGSYIALKRGNNLFFSLLTRIVNWQYNRNSQE